jgi:peptide/nickel transport system ATP-binding protein
MLNSLVETKALVKYFYTKAGVVHAVEKVDISIAQGQTLGVVGESGCGKTTLGRCILKLIPPTSGQVFFEGKEILTASRSEWKSLKQQMQIIFQDPYSSLDPRKTVFKLIAEPLVVNRLCKNKQEMQDRIYAIMETVGLSSRYANSYPHELDGGRCQRIGIARAMVMNPKFVVCDEPVSALDVSIQAQILNLMMDMQDDTGVGYMFITHDLSVVRHISHNIAVMYLGEVIELTSKEELFANPAHPYTKALLAALPVPDVSRRHKERHLIKGEISSPIDPKPGCRFAPRCPYAGSMCLEPQQMKEIAPGHMVRCCNL